MLCFASVASFPITTAAQGGVQLTYLGTAGWQISDGKTVVLIDPYLTRANMITPNDLPRTQDRRPLLTGNDIAQSDTAVIDAHIRRADFILVTHTHFDHVLDVPYIARKTGALVIGTESTINYARDCGVPQRQLRQGKGGEELEFGDLSLRVIPSLHGILRSAPYMRMIPKLSKSRMSTGVFPANAKPPFRFRDFVEGGTLAYLITIRRVEVLVFGSMNYIERNLEGLRPDVALVGAMPDRNEVRDYASRLLRVLNYPRLVLPTHWDSFNVPYELSQRPAIARLQSFFGEVRAASPHSRAFVPRYFRPIRVLPQGPEKTQR